MSRFRSYQGSAVPFEANVSGIDPSQTANQSTWLPSRPTNLDTTAPANSVLIESAIHARSNENKVAVSHHHHLSEELLRLERTHADLNTSLADLTLDASQLKGKVAVRQSEVSGMKRRVNVANNDLSTVETTVQDLTEELVRTRHRADVLNQRKAEGSAHLRLLEAQLQTSERNEAEVHHQILHLERELGTKRSQDETNQEKAAMLRRQIQVLEDNNTRSLDIVKGLEIERDSLQERERSLQTRTEELKSDIEVTKRHITKRELEKRELEFAAERFHKDASVVDGHIAAATNRTAEMESNLRQAEGRLEIKNEALRNAETRLRDMKLELEQKQAAADAKNAELRSIMTQIGSLREDVLTYDSKIRQEQGIVDDLTNKAANQELSYREYRTKASLLQERLAATGLSMESELNQSAASGIGGSLSQQIETEQASIVELQAELDTLKQTKQVITEETSHLQAEVAQAKREHENARHSLMRTQNEPRQSLSPMSSPSGIQDLELLRRNLSGGKALLAASEEEALRLRGELRDVARENDKTKAQISQLHELLDTARTERGNNHRDLQSVLKVLGEEEVELPVTQVAPPSIPSVTSAGRWTVNDALKLGVSIAEASADRLGCEALINHTKRLLEHDADRLEEYERELEELQSGLNVQIRETHATANEYQKLQSELERDRAMASTFTDEVKSLWSEHNQLVQHIAPRLDYVWGLICGAADDSNWRSGKGTRLSGTLSNHGVLWERAEQGWINMRQDLERVSELMMRYRKDVSVLEARLQGQTMAFAQAISAHKKDKEIIAELEHELETALNTLRDLRREYAGVSEELSVLKTHLPFEECLLRPVPAPEGSTQMRVLQKYTTDIEALGSRLDRLRRDREGKRTQRIAAQQRANDLRSKLSEQKEARVAWDSEISKAKETLLLYVDTLRDTEARRRKLSGVVLGARELHDALDMVCRPGNESSIRTVPSPKSPSAIPSSIERRSSPVKSPVSSGQIQVHSRPDPSIYQGEFLGRRQNTAPKQAVLVNQGIRESKSATAPAARRNDYQLGSYVVTDQHPPRHMPRPAHGEHVIPGPPQHHPGQPHPPPPMMPPPQPSGYVPRIL